MGAIDRAYYNIGDLACYEAIRNTLPKDIMMVPWYEKEYAYPKKPDLSIIGGGTIFSVLADEYKNSLYCKAKGGVTETKEKFLDQNIPTIMWGSGILPDMELYPKEMIHKDCASVLDKLEFVGLRGPISKRKVEESGFNKSQIVGDPALFLTSNKKVKKVHNRVAINLGNITTWKFGPIQPIIESTKKFIQYLINKKFEIILFLMAPQDLPLIKKIETEETKFLTFDHSSSYMINFFKTCKCVIGARLHSAVLSAAANTPFISLAYRDKCLDFVKSIDLEDFSIRTDDKNIYENLVDKFEKIDTKHNEIINKISTYKILYKHKHFEIAKIANDILRVT
jgi:polysaccharide pyruvyl transferase WcaK-like protein